MINALLDILNWFFYNIPSVAFPTIDFDGIWDAFQSILYYPVKIVGLVNITIFFALLNLDWILTLTLGVVKTVLHFIRGMR